MQDFQLWLATVFGDLTVVSALMWVGAIVGLIILISKLYPFVRRFVHTVDALGSLPESLEKIDSIQKDLEVLSELRPNHGGSIRDQITEISGSLKEHIALCKLAEAKEDHPAGKGL